MYFQLGMSQRRSSSGHYPLTPPTCAPVSLNTCTSSVEKHEIKGDSASAMLSKMACGRSTPTHQSPISAPLEEPWSDKQHEHQTHWSRQSSYVSFPDFELYYQGCDQQPEEIPA
jgi:hypothetical protein